MQVQEGASAAPAEIHGFPVWIRACFVAVAILVVVSFIRTWSVFSAAVEIERAHRDMDAGRYAQAAKRLAPLAVRYSDSTDLVLDYAESADRAGLYPESARAMEGLEGREVDEGQNSRADAIAHDLDRAYNQLSGGQK